MTETDADWPQLLTLFSGVTCVSPDLWKLVTLKCNSSAPPNLRENIPATAVCANVCFFFREYFTIRLHVSCKVNCTVQPLRHWRCSRFVTSNYYFMAGSRGRNSTKVREEVVFIYSFSANERTNEDAESRCLKSWLPSK